MPRHSLLYGDSYVELDEDHLLVSGDFRRDNHEAMWSDHPEIARLTHPVMEADTPLADLHSKPRHSHKQFKPHHFQKLQKLCALHGHQLNESHTLWDLHDMLTPFYPGIKLPRY
jgi:hypothetical protein